jgi:hypothetical protein
MEFWKLLLVCAFVVCLWMIRDKYQWSEAFELLRDSLYVLRRNPRIVLVMLAAGIGSELVETSAIFFLRSMATSITDASDVSSPGFLATLRSSFRWTWPVVFKEFAALAWVLPVSLPGAWLAALFAALFRREIRSSLFLPAGQHVKWSAGLWAGLWVSAAAALIYPAVVIAMSRSEPVSIKQARLATICIGIPAACFFRCRKLLPAMRTVSSGALCHRRKRRPAAISSRR